MHFKVLPDDPRLVGNPMVRVRDWMHKFVPMCLHGDGVRFTMKSNSLMVTNISFLLPQGFSVGATYLLWVFAKVCNTYEGVHGVDSHLTLWKYTVHALNGLFRGIHPPLDPDGFRWPEGSPSWKVAGKPIANGEFRAICWNLPMDLDQASNEHGWSHFNSNLNTCGWCPANRTMHCNIRDVSENAPWRGLLYVPGPADRLVSRHPSWGILGVSRKSYMGI